MEKDLLKLKRMWEDLNGMIFLITIGMFHGGIAYATIMSMFTGEIPWTGKLIIFITLYPFNSFLFRLLRDEVISARK